MADAAAMLQLNWCRWCRCSSYNNRGSCSGKQQPSAAATSPAAAAAAAAGADICFGLTGHLTPSTAWKITIQNGYIAVAAMPQLCWCRLGTHGLGT